MSGSAGLRPVMTLRGDAGACALDAALSCISCISWTIKPHRPCPPGWPEGKGDGDASTR